MSNVQPNAMPRKPPESAEATSNLSGCEIRASPLLLFFGGSYYESRLFLAIGLPVFRFRREIAFEDVRWFACRHDSSFRGRRA